MRIIRTVVFALEAELEEGESLVSRVPTALREYADLVEKDFAGRRDVESHYTSNRVRVRALHFLSMEE